MDDITKDKRFSHVGTDAKFRRVPKSQFKVKIDKRFQSMFTDKRFQLKYAVDKRGRAVNETQAENYKKYYDLSGESDGDSKEEKSSSEDETEEDNVSVTTETDSKSINKAKEEKKKLAKFVDEANKLKMNDALKERLQDMTVDYARGIGFLQSESSSDEPSSDESEGEFIEHPWGELDKDAEQTEEITKRLAVCHMDWDRITAKDIMILFHSFLPADGIIESVTIYPSEFGIERMKEEELKGPKELVEGEVINDFEDEEIKDKNSEGSAYHREKLREYQLKRLKYYYAVIVCNTPDAANKLYTDCDGMEYESSATKIDLRFIPDDMTFEHEPKEICSQLPDITKYKPRLFANTALQQGKVDLTWDETDPDRIEFNKKIISGDINDDDMKAYIAASSDSDEDERKEIEEKREKIESQNLDPISKYRALLADITDNQKNKDEELEISWGAGPSTKMKVADDSDDDMKSSDDEIIPQEKNKKKNKKEFKDERNEDNGELELLLADPDEDGKAHFNLKDIQKNEKLEGKKKKWRKNKNNKDVPQDDFKVDLGDNRFSALYTSHHFNIDPADPHFKKTKGMTDFIVEKQKRRKLNPEVLKDTSDKSEKTGLNPELSTLVKSIKNKSKV